MKYGILPGFFDIIPEDSKDPWRSIHIWNYVEKVLRETAAHYGFLEIRTPILERTELFQKSTGESSDIVTKEMYSFVDKGERAITLRPEGTPSVIRALIERQLHTGPSNLKLFYIGPMFRYERQQAGRYRQHHQFGAEAIGNGSPEQDVELIDLLLTSYRKLGLSNLKVCVNSIGDGESRQKFRQALLAYLEPQKEKLSAESRTRFETNPLRILDSKDPADREIVARAPSILDFLNSECLDHFQQVQALMGELGIAYRVEPKLVRGLDYYNKTVFEVMAGELGAQNSIGGGGRYDGLVESLGGPDLPSAGFGTGIERIIQTLLGQQAPCPAIEKPWLYIIALGSEAKLRAFKILHELRSQGIPAEMDFSDKKLQKMMQRANASQAAYSLVIGDEELKNNCLSIKSMQKGSVEKVSFEEIAHFLKSMVVPNS